MGSMKTLLITEMFGLDPSLLRAVEFRKIGPKILLAVLPRSEYRCNSGLVQLTPLSLDSAKAVRMGPALGSKFGCGGTPAPHAGWFP